MPGMRTHLAAFAADHVAEHLLALERTCCHRVLVAQAQGRAIGRVHRNQPEVLAALRLALAGAGVDQLVLLAPWAGDSLGHGLAEVQDQQAFAVPRQRHFLDGVEMLVAHRQPGVVVAAAVAAVVAQALSGTSR